MSSDKNFAIYAFILTSGVVTMITMTVTVGFATLPTLWAFVSHLAMSLAFKASYKSLGWPYGTFSSAGVTEAGQTTTPAIDITPRPVGDDERIAA